MKALDKRPGVLVSQMNCPPEIEAEFDRWYDEEHIPKRLALPGFTAAARYYAERDAPRHLAIYHLDSPTVLSSKAYAEVKRGQGNTPLTQRMLGATSDFTRFVGEQLSDSHPDLPPLTVAPHAFLVFFHVPDEYWEEFNAWYEQDHLPILLTAAGWLRCRRYHLTEAEPGEWNALALHDLASIDALDSPERARARATPWRERLTAHAWFRASMTALYRRREERDI